jgi:hypothetical protein
VWSRSSEVFQQVRAGWLDGSRTSHRRNSGIGETDVLGSGGISESVPQPLAGTASRARCLPMTMRWIWLVPSKICMTLASRM